MEEPIRDFGQETNRILSRNNCGILSLFAARNGLYEGKEAPYATENAAAYFRYSSGLTNELFLLYF